MLNGCGFPWLTLFGFTPQIAISEFFFTRSIGKTKLMCQMCFDYFDIETFYYFSCNPESVTPKNSCKMSNHIADIVMFE